MRVEARDPDTLERLGRLVIDPEQHPTRARTVDTDRELFLEWEAAIDDSGRLRRCLVCGCRDMYAARTFPQLTGFVVVLAFAGAAIGISGVANRYPILYGVLVIVLGLDVASLVFSKRRLVCYACRSTYAELEIARHHQRWDRALAEKYLKDSTPTADRVSTMPVSGGDVDVDFT